MEDKPSREYSSKPDFGPSESLAEHPRRRPGGSKRKVSSGFGVSSSSASAKRQAKERNNAHALLPPIHNGPVTRARQYPNKLAAAAGAGAGTDQVGKVQREDEIPVKEDEEMVEEEPLVDVEFDAVRSRATGVHVVPTHSGWFSWNNVHPLEEKMMSSFFSGKSGNRTSDAYMKIRNSIMKKFRENPHTQIEMKDLLEIAAEDSGAWKEVMEFLDYWGLINFHPFPPSNSDACAHDTDKASKSTCTLEKLYRFEALHVPSHLEPKRIGPTSPAVQLSRLLPESALPEELVRPEESSVEYHCNSCSGDCSRKRYHCQKQADFDLCSECYSAKKFGSGMVSTDFILMESAEARGGSGGSWTDQETLLLLEALELYGENWNEIAEHVATKTKAQCILHFVQMPIEDCFWEGSDSLGDILPGNTDSNSTNKESTLLDVPEMANARNVESRSSPLDAPEMANARNVEIRSSPLDAPEMANARNVESRSLPLDAPEMANARNVESRYQSATSQNYPLEKDVGSKIAVAQENNSNIAIDALKNAFQAVGSLSEQEENLSFVESGNPVMALAAFLAGLVDSSIAIMSTRSSLKAMSEDDPGLQLATRHCFPLEEPANNGKCDPSDSKPDSMCNSNDAKDAGGGNSSDAKDDNKNDTKDISVDSKGNQSDAKDPPAPVSGDTSKEENQAPDMDRRDEKESKDNKDDKCPLEELPVSSEPSKNKNIKEYNTQAFPSKEVTPTIGREAGDLPLPADHTSSGIPKDTGDSSVQEETTSKKDVSGDLPSMENFESGSTVSTTKEASDLLGDGNFSKGSNAVNSPEKLHCSATSTVMDSMSDSVFRDEDKASVVKEIAGKEVSMEDEKSNLFESEDGRRLNRVKRAAVTALAAASVKAKVFAKHEEDQIRQLVSLMIEKQLQKLESKLTMFMDIETVSMRAKEQMDRTRKRLHHERTQIIAARFGGTPSLRPTNLFLQKPPSWRT